VKLPQGGEVKVIAGTLELDGDATSGPVNSPGAKLSTDPLYLDVRLPAGAEFSAAVAAGYNAFLYTYEGSAHIGPAGATEPLPHRAAGVLSDGDERARASRSRGGALPASGGQAAARAGRAVRTVRDEHTRGN
jgi:redox-sensitive bicupin YhaK (pirin superfamily)